MVDFSVTTIFIILLLLYIFYKYTSRNYTYWEKKGIPYVKPLPFFGNLWKLFTFQKGLPELLAIYHKQFKSSYFGIFLFDKPCLVIRSPDLIKRILVKDFQKFSDRNIMSNEKYDSMASNMLFFVKNPEWKYIRAKMTPTFTSGKMKNMFGLIKDAGSDMMLYLKKQYGNEYEAKEICAKYSTDVITSCAFGLNAHSFQSESAPFRLVSRQMFDTNWKTGLHQISYFFAHSLVTLFKMPFFDTDVAGFLRNVFWDTLKQREQTKIVRNDVIDVMIEFKNNPNLHHSFKFEGDRILGQAAQFFAAGFETVSSAMSFALYELSLQPEVQDRLRLEIKNTLLEYKEINYIAIQDMKYLSMVVNETLRKYPSLPFLERICVDNYHIPNEDIIIEKGTPVCISLLGLHYDPEHFPNPEKFDPERFSRKIEENCFNYLPFGEGPRNCIGERFGLLTTKIGLVEILTKYKVEPSTKTPIPINFSPKSFFLTSPVGIPLKFKKANVLE